VDAPHTHLHRREADWEARAVPGCNGDGQGVCHTCRTCMTIRRQAMLSVRLPEDIEKRLEALAKATGRSKTYYVREALIQKLEDMEDIYLAEAVMERIASGEEKTYPLADVERELGLAD
jgi:RHH-type transcriptional regulator, rel operon repressor / antitoxin RelB